MQVSRGVKIMWVFMFWLVASAAVVQGGWQMFQYASQQTPVLGMAETWTQFGWQVLSILGIFVIPLGVCLWIVALVEQWLYPKA